MKKWVYCDGSIAGLRKALEGIGIRIHAERGFPVMADLNNKVYVLPANAIRDLHIVSPFELRLNADGTSTWRKPKRIK